MKKIPKLCAYLKSARRLSFWKALFSVARFYFLAKRLAEKRFKDYAPIYGTKSLEKTIPQLEIEAVEELADYFNYLIFIDIVMKEGKCHQDVKKKIW